MKIGFLGLGKMGSAILRGILNKGLYNTSEIAFYAPSIETQTKYTNLGLHLGECERDLFQISDIIIMAVKPQKYDEIINKLDGLNFESKIIISLAPGKTIKYLLNSFKGAKVVRAMPSTPANIGKSVTTISSTGKIDEEVLAIFSSIGTYIQVEEEKIDELIPLNGSMPAYIFEFVRDFVKSSLKYGIDEKDAVKIALHSIIGSCELALNSEDDLETLINNVCSKGGSTIMGLNELRDGGLDKIIDKCYEACVKRSKELKNV